MHINLSDGILSETCSQKVHGDQGLGGVAIVFWVELESLIHVVLRDEHA